MYDSLGQHRHGGAMLQGRPRHGTCRAEGSHDKCKHLLMLVCLWQTSYAARSL